MPRSKAALNDLNSMTPAKVNRIYLILLGNYLKYYSIHLGRRQRPMRPAIDYIGLVSMYSTA